MITPTKKPAFSQTYTDYLASPEWQAKRQELFSIRGRACEDCGSREQITVHHLTYARLGHEDISDLEILCWPCHAALEKRKGKRIAPPVEALPVRNSRKQPGMTREQIGLRRGRYLALKQDEAMRREETERELKRLQREQRRRQKEQMNEPADIYAKRLARMARLRAEVTK